MSEKTWKTWEAWEVDLITALYPTQGARPISEKTGRPMKVVQQKAKVLGVRRLGSPMAKYDYSKADPALVKIYRDRTLRALDRLSIETGIPVGSLKDRARNTLKLPPMCSLDRHQRPWVEEEELIIEQYGESSLKKIQHKLKISGFERSLRGIECRVSLLRARATRVELITLSDFTRRMGYDVSHGCGWIKKGWLKGIRDKMYVKEAINPDKLPYWISRKEAKRFLIENVSAYDHRRIDWMWALDILTNRSLSADSIPDSVGSGDGEYHMADAA